MRKLNLKGQIFGSLFREKLGKYFLANTRESPLSSGGGWSGGREQRGGHAPESSGHEHGHWRGGGRLGSGSGSRPEHHDGGGTDRIRHAGL